MVFQGAQMFFLDPQRQEVSEQVLAEDRQQGQASLYQRLSLWPEVLWCVRWARAQVEIGRLEMP